MSLFGECRTDVRKSISSPDAENVVVVFGKECNATVGFNTQLSIAPAGSALSAEKYPAFFVTSGLHVVQVAWRDDGAVEITLIPGGGKIFRNEERAGSIRVIYP